MFPPGLSEEQKEYAKQQITRQRMAIDEQQNRVKRFLAELSADNLRTFSLMVMRMKGDPGFIHYMEGQADAVLTMKYNICAVCGVNHDEDLQAAMQAHGELPPTPPPSEVQPLAVPPEHIGQVPPIFDDSIPDDLSMLDAVHNPDFLTEEDPQNPGFDMEGNRLASCSSCGGDKYIKVCNHAPGMHGQSAMDGLTCPEPLHVPCPECSAPAWYTFDTLQESPCHPSPDTKLLPIEIPYRVVCSACGTPYIYQEPKPETES